MPIIESVMARALSSFISWSFGLVILIYPLAVLLWKMQHLQQRLWGLFLCLYGWLWTGIGALEWYSQLWPSWYSLKWFADWIYLISFCIPCCSLKFSRGGMKKVMFSFSYEFIAYFCHFICLLCRYYSTSTYQLKGLVWTWVILFPQKCCMPIWINRYQTYLEKVIMNIE